MNTTLHALAAAAALALAALAPAQTATTFTYQGRLTDAGAPADGLYDLTFTLWSVPFFGTQIGSPVVITDLPVENGVFTAPLDFGADTFNGSQRWLQIAVDGTTLAPRTPVTGAPYSIQTRGIFANNDLSFVGVGRESQISSTEVFGISDNTSGFAGMYVHTSGANGNPYYGYSAGGSVDAYHAVDGATGDWYLVNNGAVRMTVDASGNVGIDNTNPTSLLDVAGNIKAEFFVTPHPNSQLSAFYASGNNLNIATFGGGPIRFITSSTPGGAGLERMAISSSGGVTVAETLGVGGPAVNAVLSSSGGAQHAGYLVSEQTGVWGATTSTGVGRYGVFGQHPSGSSYGVWASGNMGASGTKSFRIDHPLAPQSKYLLHYCAEAPEPLNVYSGVVTLDENGRAWVALPDYFTHINRDPRYQLTCIGGFANVYIASEVVNNHFQIAGGSPGLRVSWEVKGVRNDPWVRANGAPAVMDKPAEFQGLYLHPELYGLPNEFAEHPSVPAQVYQPSSVQSP